jgi:hypothetical protein
MPAKNGFVATIKLNPQRDQDLINWLNQIPPGGRNAALKHVLRCGLDLPQPVTESAPVEKLEALAGEVSTLKQVVSRMPGLIKSQAGSDPRMDELERMVINLQLKIENMAMGIPQDDLSPVIDVAPELSIEDKQQRANKLKKASW